MPVKFKTLIGIFVFAVMWVTYSSARPALETDAADDDADDDEFVAAKDEIEKVLYSLKFPEQELVSPFLLKDGQAFWDKLYVMKMMHLLEQEAAAVENNIVSGPRASDYVFEGDIILTKTQAISLVQLNANSKRRRHKRKMDVDVTSWTPSKKWKLPINYVVDETHTEKERAAIQAGIELWENETCLSFVNNVNHTGKHVQFIRDRGCYAYVGQNPNRNSTKASIGPMCTHIGTVAHEIGHVLGFWHEHARPDRDEYLNIVLGHVRAGDKHNFQRLTWGDVNSLGVQFDYGSLMLYNSMTFATIGQSMESKNRLFTNTMGQRNGVSFYDVKLVNRVYCNETCDPDDLLFTCLNDGYQDPKNCSRCRCAEGLAGDQCETVAPSRGKCGGEVNLTAGFMVYISAPGFPGQYPADISCYWLVRSPPGSSVRMQFVEPYMQSKSCDESSMYGPCTDFVEIRFTDNLGMTGGRLCCNDSIQSDAMSSPIISHSNHALILFKSYDEGYRGFQMKLTIDSCGGCHDNVTSEQTPCLRHVIKDCNQTWTSIVKEKQGCGWLSYYCHDSYKIVTRSRPSTCHNEEPFCCHGYKLSNDSTLCIANFSISDNSSTESSGEDYSTSSNSVEDLSKESDQGSVWSPWSSWSTCSRECGGCGQQNRSRACLLETDCGGDPDESRVCGAVTCPVVARYCSEQTIHYYDCSSFFEPDKTCSETYTKYKVVVSGCCCGYEEKDDMCVKESK